MTKLWQFSDETLPDTIPISDLSVHPATVEVTEYIRSNHYTGTCCPASTNYKLTTRGRLVGGIVFTAPASESARRYVAGEGCEDQVLSLHRLYTDDDCGKNVESWFIARALDRLKQKQPERRFIIAYADQSEGHNGTIYKASNAVYTGTTGKTVFYRDAQKNLRSPRQSGVNITIEDARERGWITEKRDAKHRYVLPLPDQYESRSDVIADLDCETHPYPKHQ
jgi:hypothetical protein